MNKAFVKATFVVAFVMVIFSAIAKILHVENADTYLLISLFPSYLCFGYVLYSIFSSQKMQLKSKAFWLIFLFLIGWPIMLLYVFVEDRKRKVNKGLRTT